MYIKSQNNFASECAASLTLSLSLATFWQTPGLKQQLKMIPPWMFHVCWFGFDFKKRGVL